LKAYALEKEEERGNTNKLKSKIKIVFFLFFFFESAQTKWISLRNFVKIGRPNSR